MSFRPAVALAPLIGFLVALMALLEPCSTTKFAHRDDCFNSCSEDINCTIMATSSCIYPDFQADRNIPGSPFNIRFEETSDGTLNFLNIYWEIPQDGSFNYLTGFSLDVESVGPLGLSGRSCFHVKLGDNWTMSHAHSDKEHGIGLFAKCIGVSVKEFAMLQVTIMSIPTKTGAPKFMPTLYTMGKEKNGSEFKVQKWSDENGILYIDIQNPSEIVKTVQIRISSEGDNKDVFFTSIKGVIHEGKKVFSNKLVSQDGFPYIVVPGLDQKIAYMIYIQEMNFKDDPLPTLHTKFKFPDSGKPDEVVLSPEVDDNRLVIILVSISIAIVAIIIFCLIWRGKIWLKLRDWAGYSTETNPTRNNRRGVPRILPIYCFENANYVKAVESHVSLLRRYVDVLNFPPEFQLDCFVCGSRSQEHSWSDSDVKDSEIIIYLSPKLGTLLKNDLDTSNLSQQDTICAQSMRLVREHRLRSQCAKPLMVTFDCFQRAELELLEELKDFLLLSVNSQVEDPLLPVTLASFSSNYWQLENLDQLLFKVYKLSEYPAHFYPSISGWRDCLEAREAEQFLSLFTGSDILEASMEQLDANDNLHVTGRGLHVSSEIGSYRSVSTVDCDSINAHMGLTDFVSINEDPEFSSAVPLITRSSGFVSGSLRADNSTSTNQPPGDGTHFLTSNQQKRLHNLPSKPDCSNAPLLYPRQTINCKDLSSSVHIPDDDGSGAVVFNDSQSSREFNRVMYQPKAVKDLNCSPGSLREQYSPCIGERDSQATAPYRVHLNGKVPISRDGFNKCDSEWVINNASAFAHLQRIIPPSMCFSNSTSIDSVCERINKVNESAAWSNSDLA